MAQNSWTLPSILPMGQFEGKKYAGITICFAISSIQWQMLLKDYHQICFLTNLMVNTSLQMPSGKQSSIIQW